VQKRQEPQFTPAVLFKLNSGLPFLPNIPQNYPDVALICPRILKINSVYFESLQAYQAEGRDRWVLQISNAVEFKVGIKIQYMGQGILKLNFDINLKKTTKTT
jgi:hypothetical protein